MTKETFYITKWALTRGILKRDCELYTSPGSVTKYATKRDENIFCRIGKDAFLDERAAQTRVSRLIDDKIKSLERTKTKLLKIKTELLILDPVGT